MTAHTPPPADAEAWLHTMHMEHHQTAKRLSFSMEPAFGTPGRDYSAEYPVTVVPLYAAVPAPPADAEMDALVEPWKDHNGPLPDYDSPVACVFDSGVQYAVELLAKELGVTDWTPCDGTEEYDGDLGGTLMNIVREALPLDQDNERMWPSDVATTITTLRTKLAEAEARVGRLRVALDPFARVARIQPPGSHRWSPEKPNNEFIPSAWPDWGDFSKANAALTNAPAKEASDAAE